MDVGSLIGTSWITVEDPEEAAALATAGCEMLPGRPITRSVQNNHETVVFHFSGKGKVGALRKLWRDEVWLGKNPGESIALSKRAFAHRSHLDAARSGTHPLELPPLSTALAALHVSDIELAASMMTLGIPLIGLAPSAGLTSGEFLFERTDDAVFLVKAWEDERFVIDNPRHALSHIKTAFENFEKLAALVKNTYLGIFLKDSRFRYLFHRAPNATPQTEAENLKSLVQFAYRAAPYAEQMKTKHETEKKNPHS